MALSFNKLCFFGPHFYCGTVKLIGNTHNAREYFETYFRDKLPKWL